MSRAVVIRLLTAALLFTSVLAPRRASAGGLEYTAAGATALGRAGAVTARADDPMVLLYNPAGLAELRGSQLLFDTNIALMNACVDPIGYYGWGMYPGHKEVEFVSESGARRRLDLGTNPNGAAEKAYYNDPLDTVCLDQNVVPVPQLIATTRLSEDLGIGAGLVFPAISPTGQWGDDNGLIRGDTGELRPAATRYMLLNTGNIGVFPTLGVGYRLTRWLRLGAALEWGMIWVDTTTMGGIGTGTAPDNDVKARIRARDLFIPGFTASVHLVPIDALDIVAAFRFQDDIVTPGKLDLTTGFSAANSVARTTKDLDVTSLTQRMPWKLRAGIRYADRLVPRPTGTGGKPEGGLYPEPVRDAFQDERWDVELDVEYQMNSRNKEQILEYKPGQIVEFQARPGVSIGETDISTATFPDPSAATTRIKKHWKDQISVRAGGSYNIFPGIFGVMGGVHYETRGIDPSYMQIDFWPVSRLGLHGGITFRVAGTTDLVFSYAHIFQETIVVGAPSHLDANSIFNEYVASGDKKVVKHIDKTVGIKVARTDPDPPVVEEQNKPKSPDGEARLQQVTTKVGSGAPPWIVNSGTYRSSMNVVSVGVHAHF